MLLALFIFTSLIKGMPWYEPWGIQILGIFLVCVPGLFFSFLINVALGLFTDLPVYDKFFPFLIAILVIIWHPTCLLFQYKHPSPEFLHFLGLTYSVICFLAIRRLIKNLRSNWKQCLRNTRNAT